jgi:hypothetical protein
MNNSKTNMKSPNSILDLIGYLHCAENRERGVTVGEIADKFICTHYAAKKALKALREDNLAMIKQGRYYPVDSDRNILNWTMGKILGFRID